METKIDQFLSNFQPSWGYKDIGQAIEVYEQAGKTEQELAEAVQSFFDDTSEYELDDIDVCYVAYDSLHQEARTEIEQATGKDISNDSPFDGVNVYGNYMCTEFDGKDEDRKALKDLIATIKEPSKVVLWLSNQM